jgi:DNA repair protein RadA
MKDLNNKKNSQIVNTNSSDAKLPTSNGFTTAKDHYANRLKSIERISTGCKNLDDLLGGGIETKAITEFYGESGSGKTQLCHTLCTMVPQNKSKDGGGVDGKSIYIDTEGTFRPERIAEIAKARGFDSDMILDNIIVQEAIDSNQQEQIVKKIDSFIAKDKSSKKLKLLILDSVVTHYRAEYTGREMLSERQQKLYRS